MSPSAQGERARQGEVDCGHQGGSMQDELERVRQQLNRLVMSRLLCGFSEDDEDEYERLSRRERQLMTLQNASSN